MKRPEKRKARPLRAEDARADSRHAPNLDEAGQPGHEQGGADQLGGRLLGQRKHLGQKKRRVITPMNMASTCWKPSSDAYVAGTTSSTPTCTAFSASSRSEVAGGAVILRRRSSRYADGIEPATSCGPAVILPSLFPFYPVGTLGLRENRRCPQNRTRGRYHDRFPRKTFGDAGRGFYVHKDGVQYGPGSEEDLLSFAPRAG